MKLERILSGIIGLPVVALILIFGNIYLIDVFFAFVAVISIYEYFKCFKKDGKPIEWIGYLYCFLIVFLHIIPKEYYLFTFTMAISIIIATLFIHVVISNMKISLKDIMVTLFNVF